MSFLFFYKESRSTLKKWEEGGGRIEGAGVSDFF